MEGNGEDDDNEAGVDKAAVVADRSSQQEQVGVLLFFFVGGYRCGPNMESSWRKFSPGTDVAQRWGLYVWACKVQCMIIIYEGLEEFG